jgi:hypothetical protein
MYVFLKGLRILDEASERSTAYDPERCSCARGSVERIALAKLPQMSLRPFSLQRLAAATKTSCSTTPLAALALAFLTLLSAPTCMRSATTSLSSESVRLRSVRSRPSAEACATCDERVGVSPCGRDGTLKSRASAKGSWVAGISPQSGALSGGFAGGPATTVRSAACAWSWGAVHTCAARRPRYSFLPRSIRSSGVRCSQLAREPSATRCSGLSRTRFGAAPPRLWTCMAAVVRPPSKCPTGLSSSGGGCVSCGGWFSCCGTDAAVARALLLGGAEL